MIRYLLLALFIWLLFRFIRGFFILRSAARKYARQQDLQKEKDIQPPPKSKLISKEEGEYVDFEEV